MKRFLIVVGVGVFVLLGVIIPKVMIPDIQVDAEGESEYAPKYALVRVGNAGGFIQNILRMKLSVVDVHDDPGGCDWGYREPVTGSATVRVYTLWGIPLETWEVSCDSENLVSSPW